MGDQTGEDDIQERVFKVVKQALDLEPAAALNIDASISGELASDSIDEVTLFLALEDEFNDTIPEKEIEQLKTIRNIVSYIKGRIEAA